MQTGSHITRQRVSLALLVVAWLVMGAKIAGIQVLEHNNLHLRATSQRVQPVTLKGDRGRILDRNGVELAVNIAADSYGFRGTLVEDIDAVAGKIAEAAGIDKSRIRTMAADKSFQWLVRNADPKTARKLDALNLDCIEKIPGSRRYYPLGMIGAQLIGYTDVDGKGIEGCEFFLDETLAGRDGRGVVVRDARQQVTPSYEAPQVAPRDGSDVTLTIDWRIQEIAEEELAAGIAKYGAKSGGVIVMDTETGEILAMANAPRFDPNDLNGSGAVAPEFRKNRMATDMLEPGSTFKIVSLIEALESGVVTEDDMIDCEGGEYTIGRHVINDSHELDMATVREVMVHSSNIGTVKITEMIGKQKFYERIRQLGFGEVTGFDLPGETSGMLENPRDWSNLSLPTISYGQGIAVSPLQLISAWAAIANGGTLRSPRVIAGVRDSDGKPVGKSDTQDIRRTMKPETAFRMTDLLCQVVESGTGASAAIPGVRIAGKTGTAQRVREGGSGYEPGLYISSFIGFIADRDPRILCYVIVDSPKGVHYGSQVAAPVFRNVMNRMLNMGDNFWTKQVASAGAHDSAPARKLPDLEGRDMTDAIAAIEKLGLAVEVVGDSTKVVRQLPLPGAELVAGDMVTLYSNMQEMTGENRVRVPNLKGRTVREAVQQLVQANLEVTINGSGIVHDQTPRAGTEVAYGTICTIACRK